MGSKSLLYFENFEPRYIKAFGQLPGSTQTYDELHKRFYEQNGLNEAKLVEATEALKEAVTTAEQQHAQQKTTQQSISQSWTGDAGTSAQAMMTKQSTLAWTDIEKAKSVISALELAPKGLREAAKIKADVVLQIREHGLYEKIDGKTPENVDDIINGAGGISWSNFYSGDSEANRIHNIFPDIGQEMGLSGKFFNFVNHAGIVAPGSEWERAAKERCQKWLDEVFKGDYIDKVNKFLEACDGTDRKVKEVYGAITTAMGGIAEESYPCPVGPSTPSNPGPSTPGPSTPGPSTPGPSPGPGTTDDPSVDDDEDDDDTSTNPSAADLLEGLTSAAQTLSPLVSTLAQSLSTGLTSLSGVIEDGVDNALEYLKEQQEDAAGKEEEEEQTEEGKEKDDDKSAFDLAGKNLKLEMGPDGQLKLVATDSEGNSQEYSVKLDENGNPVIVGQDAEPDGEKSEDKPNEGSQNDQGSPGPGGIPSVPGSKKEEDGEHTPQPIPAPTVEEEPEAPVPTPEPPFDSGARLAEAGPL